MKPEFHLQSNTSIFTELFARIGCWRDYFYSKADIRPYACICVCMPLCVHTMYIYMLQVTLKSTTIRVNNDTWVNSEI